MIATATNCYQRYSTAFKLNVVLSENKNKFKDFIPDSTIAYWKKQNFNEYLGFDMDSQSDLTKEIFSAIVRSKNYAKLCKGLLSLLNLYDYLLSASQKRKKVYKRNQGKIISCFDELKNYLPISTIQKRLHVTAQKISRWKAQDRCSLSALKLCVNLHPNQLTFDEQLLLKDALLSEKNEHLYTSFIWSKLQRENGLMISLNTAYKYSNEIFGRPEKVKGEKPKIQITANHPFEILHMDSTPLVLKNKEKVYIHFIMDNYSRAVLGGVVSHSSKSAVVAENLKLVLKDYNLFYKPFTLYCDGGPENEGDVNKLLTDEKIRIEKIVANYLNETTNNMAEAWHKRFKEVVLKHFSVNNAEELIQKLPEMIEYANNLYLPVLKTLSPNEVLNGKTVADLNIKEKTYLSKRKRIEENKAFNCKVRCKQK